MHQRLLDEIARVHDCGGDEKTRDLRSGIEGAEGGADSSEEGGYTLLCMLVEILNNDSGLTYNCDGHQDYPKRKKVASSPSETCHEIFNNTERGDL